MIHIDFDGTDAQGFKEIVSKIVSNSITSCDPDELSIVRIKNWFDHKWLNYSGKRLEEYDTKSHAGIPFVLEPYWNEDITVPVR